MDISRLSNQELRAIATRNLVECRGDCRAMLCEQLEDEEFAKEPLTFVSERQLALSALGV